MNLLNTALSLGLLTFVAIFGAIFTMKDEMMEDEEARWIHNYGGIDYEQSEDA